MYVHVIAASHLGTASEDVSSLAPLVPPDHWSAYCKEHSSSCRHLVRLLSTPPDADIHTYEVGADHRKVEEKIIKKWLLTMDDLHDAHLPTPVLSPRGVAFGCPVPEPTSDWTDLTDRNSRYVSTLIMTFCLPAPSLQALGDLVILPCVSIL